MNKKLSIMVLVALLTASCFSGCVEDTTITVEDFVLMISEISYNSTGGISNDFIELFVVDSEGNSIDVSGWYVTTFDDDEEYLPAVSDLEQFDYLALRMGAGVDDLDASDGGATIYFNRLDSMLDISGDEVGLYNADDELVDFVRYNGGNNDSALGGWNNSDLGAIANNSMESIQIHGQDWNDSSNWISAPPSPAEPNIDEWLMDVDLNLYYQIHNGQNRDVDLTGTPWDDLPEWEIYNESGPVSNEDKNTVRSWLNDTYKYMKEKGLGTPRTKDTDNKVHVHITKRNKPASGRATRNGEIYVKIGNLSDRNESIKSKRTIEHEQVHLIQYNNSGAYGPYNDWTDLEGMADYWSTKITMSNFNITFDELIEAYDDVYRKYGYSERHDRWLKNTDRDYFQKFRRPAHIDWYWALHMFLRFIEEQFGEDKVRHIFRVRNSTSGIVGIINATNKAFEEQDDHNETFEDLFINFSSWIWSRYERSITLARNLTFDGNTTINESGFLYPWGIDYERVANPTLNATTITFKGDPNKEYSITVLGYEGNDTYGGIDKQIYRFRGEIKIDCRAGFHTIILIKIQLNCHTYKSYSMNVTKYILVNNPPVTPYEPSPQNASTDVSLDTRLDWLCYDPDGDNVTFDVYLGTSPNPPKIASNQTSIIYRLDETLSPGTKYYWRIIARDSHGAKTEGPLWSFTTAENTPPVIENISYEVGEELMIYFTVIAEDYDGEIVSYFWDFGDGNTSTEQNPSHSYAAEGEYTGELTITDNYGATATVIIIVIVEYIIIE
ncbi:MAG: PKD domain-containing protein [Thermoplasmatales archaeon]|nr:MAG: PKD domain-containing protein [Thermoplasmatales archaeon]